jgi:chromosome partitioning protein
MIAAHPREMRIIAVVSNKGGVGKSTTAFNVGAEAVLRGMKVLLVDADRQADLTSYAGQEILPWKGLDGVLRNPPMSLDPRPFLRPRLSGAHGAIEAMQLLGSSPHLPEVDEVIRSGFSDGSFYLRRALDVVKADFDLAIVDLGHSTELIRNVLGCADVIVVPTPANFPDARHAGDMLHEIGMVRGQLGLPRIEAIRRTVVSAWRRHPNAAGDAQVLSRLRDLYGDCLSPNILPECAYVSEANASRLTLREFREQYPRTGGPLQALVDGYSALTNFVMARLPEEIPA